MAIPVGLASITTATRLLMANDRSNSFSCIVVTFRSGPKKYAYLNRGFKIKKGDIILVPTKSGNDLEATVVLRTNSNRWLSKATKEIIG